MKKALSLFFSVCCLALLMASSSYATGNDSNTVLLIQSDNTDGDTTFTDTSVGASATHTITAYDDVHHETDQAKLGGSSIYFNGELTSGSYLVIDKNEDYEFGNGNFTIDLWAYPTNSEYRGVLAYNNHDEGIGHYGYYIYHGNGSNQFVGRFIDSARNGYSVTASGSNLNQWNHVALVRIGSTLKIFLNGVEKDSINTLGTATMYTNSVQKLNIGAFYSNLSETYSFPGYLDEIRISKGIARTEDPNDPLYLTIDSDEDGINDSFPVPTAPYDENPTILSLTTSPDPASGAAPLTVDFEVTVVGGTSPYTYSWDFDGDSVADSTDQNPEYTYTSAGSYTATVTVTDDNSKTATGSIDVSVEQPLEIDSYSATPSAGTAPLTVNFSVTATGGTAPYTYAWDFDNDGIEDSTDQNPEYTYTSAYSGNANITVTDADENIVSQNISINITGLTTEDCYASYNFLYDKFHVSCFAIEGEVYSFDMTINDVEIDEASIVKIK